MDRECWAELKCLCAFIFFFQAEDGIRDVAVTGVQTCALPISSHCSWLRGRRIVASPAWPGGHWRADCFAVCDALRHPGDLPVPRRIPRKSTGRRKSDPVLLPVPRRIPRKSTGSLFLLPVDKHTPSASSRDTPRLCPATGQWRLEGRCRGSCEIGRAHV